MRVFSFPFFLKIILPFSCHSVSRAPQVLPQQSTNRWPDSPFLTCLRMNLIKTSLLLKNQTLGCYSLPDSGGVGQPLPCCRSHECGSVSVSCAGSVSDLVGFGASPKPALAPCSATLALCCKSVEAALLPSDLHVKNCRLCCNMRFLCLVDCGKKVGREREVSPSTGCFLLLSRFRSVNQRPMEVAAFYSHRFRGFNISLQSLPRALIKVSARKMCGFAVAGFFPLHFFSGFGGSLPNLSAICFKMYFFP